MHDSQSIAILGVVRKDPWITGKKLTECTRVSERTVWRRLAVLKRGGLLSNSMGPRQRPGWNVTPAGLAALKPTTITRAKPQVIDVSGATLALVETGSAPGRVRTSCLPTGEFTAGQSSSPLAVQTSRILADKDRVIADLRQADAASRVHITRVEAERDAERKALVRAEAELIAARAEIARLRDPRRLAASLVPAVPMDAIPAQPVSSKGKRAPRPQTEDQRVISELQRRVAQLTGENDGLQARVSELEQLPAQVAELQQTVAQLTGQRCGAAVPQWTFEDLERLGRD